MEERKVWVMNLLDNEKIDPETGNRKSNFEFCKQRNIVGIGWGLCEHATTDYNEYKELTKLEGRYYKNGKYNDNLKVAMDCFEEMDEGDLILLHDKYVTFYICEVLDKKIDVNQGALYFEANVTCNKRVKYFDMPIKEAELQKLGMKRRNYIARRTIERLPISLAKELEDYIRETYPSYLS